MRVALCLFEQRHQILGRGSAPICRQEIECAGSSQHILCFVEHEEGTRWLLEDVHRSVVRKIKAFVVLSNTVCFVEQEKGTGLVVEHVLGSTLQSLNERSAETYCVLC